MEFEMRTPKNEEWEAISEVPDVDTVMNSFVLFNWCWDFITPLRCVTRSLIDANEMVWASSPDTPLGFRPAFVPTAPDNIPDWTIVKVGTLFMNGEPVRVPTKPIRESNITKYIPGAKLELGPPDKSSKYQIKAFKTGNIYIADRPILSDISWFDLEKQGLTQPVFQPHAMLPDAKTMQVALEYPINFHWEKEFFWIADEPGLRQGYLEKDFLAAGDPRTRSEKIGFRPVFSGTGTVWGDIHDPIATLYMNGKPVKIPRNPVYDGDITEYIPGAKLEFKFPLLDEEYQIKAVAIGDKFVADRCVLCNISWDDLKAQGFCD